MWTFLFKYGHLSNSSIFTKMIPGLVFSESNKVKFYFYYDLIDYWNMGKLSNFDNLSKNDTRTYVIQ